MNSLQQENSGPPTGSLDGDGAGDHDQPYRFGSRPRASVPYPFNTRQYGRLLVLRGRIADGLLGQEEVELLRGQDANLRPAA